MEPRITINVSEDGVLELWLNEAGRDLLVKYLKTLSTSNDHLHLGADETWADIKLGATAYRASDKLIDTAKILFRTDGWDSNYFPHVME